MVWMWRLQQSVAWVHCRSLKDAKRKVYVYLISPITTGAQHHVTDFNFTNMSNYSPILLHYFTACPTNGKWESTRTRWAHFAHESVTDESDSMSLRNWTASIRKCCPTWKLSAKVVGSFLCDGICPQLQTQPGILYFRIFQIFLGSFSRRPMVTVSQLPRSCFGVEEQVW